MTNTTPVSTETLIAKIRAEIDNGLKLAFDYTNAHGETKAVEAFTPESLRQLNSDVLLTGLTPAGRYRSYYIGRMAGTRVLASA